MSGRRAGTVVLTGRDVERLLTMREAIGVVERAFADHAQGKTQMLPRSYLFLDEYAGRIGFMPAHIKSLDAAGIKIVCAYHDNPKLHGLPSVTATVVLNDTKTGLPLAIMDGTYLTMIRTGAVGGIAAKYLARRNAKIVGIVGAGVQGRGQLRGVAEVRDVERVLVYDPVPEQSRKFASEMGRELSVDVLPVDSAQRAVMGVDLVAVATPSSTPVVMSEWVGPGLHITSVGVSTAGKQEIATEVFKRGKLVLDELSQTSKIGGINVPFSRGLLRSEDVYAEIGEIILGKKPGRTSDEEVTVFVSSGLAIQDVATAKLVYDKALQQGMGTKVNLV